MRTHYVLLLLPLLASGCAHAQAKTTAAVPLEMPAPPPRDVEPVEADAPPPMPLAQEPAHNPPGRPRTPVRTEPAKPDVAKPDAPPDTPKPADEPPKPAPAPQPTLQTAPTTTEIEMERAIRGTLARAMADLNRVDYRALNTDARTQYDTAKRFVNQADDAIRAKNFVFAKNVADKAAALAGQLDRR
jgi:outer membrane biosynthesis protein TonB